MIGTALQVNDELCAVSASQPNYDEQIREWKEKLKAAEAMTDEDDKNASSYWDQKEIRMQCAKGVLQTLEDEFALNFAIKRINRSYLEIGKTLAEMHKRYTIRYPDKSSANRRGWLALPFNQYVTDRLGIKRSTAYTLISVYHHFSDDKCKLLHSYAGFSYSQLVEMVSMDDSDIKKIKPSMTVKEIREIKANINAKQTAKPQPVLSDPVRQETVVIETECEVLPGQLAIDTEQASPVPTSGQPEPASFSPPAAGLVLKNDNARRDWLKNFKEHCYLWVDVAPLAMQVYRYDFRNGDSLLVTVYRSSYGDFNSLFQIHEKACKRPYYPGGSDYTCYVDYLRQHREEL